MSNTDQAAFERFLHGQIAAWNAKDKEAFFEHYRSFAPNGLTIEYVGKSSSDGWPILEGMWANQADKINVEVVCTIINGDEAACHHINRVIGSEVGIKTIEIYRYGEGKLRVRYFIAA